MPDEIKNVGFIGLGRMGAAMSQNILKAGFQVTVYNRSPGKTLPLIEKGAAEAASPKLAAQGADVVITCLMDDKSMLENVNGADGILAGLKTGGIHIGTATI